MLIVISPISMFIATFIIVLINIVYPIDNLINHKMFILFSFFFLRTELFFALFFIIIEMKLFYNNDIIINSKICNHDIQDILGECPYCM